MRTITLCLSFLALGGYAISQNAAPGLATNGGNAGKVEIAAAIDVPPSAGEDGAREDIDRTLIDALPASWGRYQDPDYTVAGMFQRDHGEFMIQRRRFQPHVVGSLFFMPNGGIDGEGGDLELTNLDFDAKVPVAVSPDGYLEVGGYYGARHYDASNVAGFTDETLHRLGIHFGGGYFIREDILVEGMISPGIYSDFDSGLHGDDFKFFTSGLVTWQTREDIFIKAGFAYNETFRDARLLPVFGISWLATPEWRVDVLLANGPDPARDGGRFEVSYATDTSTTLYGALDIEGQQYHVRGTGGFNRTDINVQEFRIAFGGIHRFSDYLSGFAEIGAVVAGDYKVRDDSTTGYADGTLDPAFFIQVGAGWTF